MAGDANAAKNVAVQNGGADSIAANQFFSQNPSNSVSFSPASVVSALNGAGLTIQANNDFSVNNVLDATPNASAGSLTLQAGRSGLINANIITKNSNLSLSANDSGATSAFRDAGVATIAMAPGTSINTGTGNLAFMVGAGASGNIALANITGNQLTIQNSGASAGSGIAFNGATTLAGALFASANGPISQSGPVVVGGAASFSAGISNDITFGNAGNDFTTIGIGSGDNVTLRDANALVLASSTITGNFSVTTGGAMAQSGPIVANGAGKTTTLAAGPNNITLNSAANDFTTVAISSAQSVALADINALTFAASSVSGSLAVTALGDVAQSGPVTVAGASSFNVGANNIVLGNPLNDFNTVTIMGGNSVILSDANAITLGPSSVAGALTVTSGGSVAQTGALLVVGNSVFAAGPGADIFLDNTANDFGSVSILSARDVLLTDSNSLVFGGMVAGRNLAIQTAGSLSLMGTVSLVGSIALTPSGDIVMSGGTITTGSAQSYTGPVIFGTNMTLSSSSGGDLLFASALNADIAPNNRNLMLNTAGNVVFNGTVGASQALGSLTTDAGGATHLNGGSVTTTGDQVYGDTVLLGAVTTLNGAIIRFGSTLNGAHPLTINGQGNFNGAVGGSTPLSSLAVTGTTVLNGGIVNSIGAQVYVGAVALVATATLTSPFVVFGSTLEGAHALIVNGSVNFAAPVGDLTRPTSIVISGTTAINGGRVSSTGIQTYGGAVSLATDTVLSGSSVAFGSSLSGGNHDLTLDLSGASVIAGSSLTAIKNFTSTGLGSVQLSGALSTSGIQTVGNLLTLVSNAILQANRVEVLASGILAGTGNIAAPVVNAGRVVADATTLTFAQAVTNNGTLRADHGGTLQLNGPVVNNGIIDLINGQANFGSNFINNGIVLYPNNDDDGDGVSNLAEYSAGTDPLSAASVLRVLSVTNVANNVRITWSTVGGKKYVLQAVTPPPGGYSTNFTNISPEVIVAGNGGESLTNFVEAGAASNAPARYYRVKLSP